MRSTLFLVYNPADPRQVTAAKVIGRISERPVDSLDLRAPTGAAPVPDPAGLPAPTDDRSQPLREELLRRFDRAAKVLVLIAETTHEDPWVDWQVKSYYELKDPLYFPNTWKILRGLRLRGCVGATLPPALDGRSTSVSEWEPEAIQDWLEREMEI